MLPTPYVPEVGSVASAFLLNALLFGTIRASVSTAGATRVAVIKAVGRVAVVASVSSITRVKVSRRAVVLGVVTDVLMDDVVNVDLETGAVMSLSVFCVALSVVVDRVARAGAGEDAGLASCLASEYALRSLTMT